MTKTKSTKSALISSVIALFLCFTMLLGTTFAWFTDSVTSAGNKIMSGTLRVDLELLDKDSGTWSSIKEDKAALFNNDKWEPGYTEVKMLKVENEGTLALKWKAKFVAADELGILADVIDVYVRPYDVLTEEQAKEVAYPTTRDLEAEDYTKVGTVRDFVNTIETTTTGKLEAGEAAYLGIALKMQESANNDYQGKELGAFDILILATQLDSEEDSFGKDYDADAEYPSVSDNWDGTADVSWYDENVSEFHLTSAEQLAGLNELIASGVTFAGKTIKLNSDMDMSGTEWKPATTDFSGTFDGQGYTISNLARTVNTYESGGRSGLFGHIEGGTVKNVTLDSAAFYGYGPYGGVVAGSAYGECVFENITLTNCTNEMYNTGSAGIVGLAYSDSDYTFKNISIDDSNSIGGYWGTYDIAAGALIGYFWKSGDALSPVSVEDCYIAPVMNVYNDVCANYQWYAYRYSGMLIGYVNGSTTNVDGTTYPLANTVTCTNVTVEYGDWANYYYCELESNGHPSYAGENDYKFSRLIPISSVDEMSSEEYAWDNHFVLIDGDNVTCYHVTRDSDTREITGYHTHTEAEDNICKKLTFDQLFGGGQGVYGDSDHEGVTVIYNNK